MFASFAAAQPPPTKKVEKSDSEDEADIAPDKFADIDNRNHQLFMQNPLYVEMVKAVFEQLGPIDVQTSPAGGGKAGWHAGTKQISITDKMQGAKRASAMMFETTNAFHTSRAKDIDDRITDYNENTYAHAQERIEYDGICKHHEIMKYGVEKLGWPPELDRYATLLATKWSSFDGYLKMQEEKEHTNLHRSNFNTKIEALRDATSKAAKAKQSMDQQQMTPQTSTHKTDD